MENSKELKEISRTISTEPEPIEVYLERMIKEGYINEEGAPLKCLCGCTEFKQVNQYYGEGWIEEYDLECTNEDCLSTVGHWAYGHWSV